MSKNLTFNVTDVESPIHETTSYDHWVNSYFLITGASTVILNMLVVYINIYYVDLKAKPNQMFVLSMSLADLGYGLIYQLSRPLVAHLPLVMCGPYYIIVWACQLGSVNALFMLNVDKFIRIRYILHYRRLITYGNVLTITIIQWSLIFVIALFSYAGPFLHIRADVMAYRGACLAVDIQPIYYVLYILIGYTVPLIASVTISIIIFILAHRASRSSIRRASLPQRQHSSTISNGTRHNSVMRSSKNSKLVMRRIVFVFASTVWTAATFLPYRLAYILYRFCTVINEPSFTSDYNSTMAINETLVVDGTRGHGIDSCAGVLMTKLIDVLMLWMMLGTVGNPVITIRTQNTYLTRVKAMWPCRLCFTPPPLRPSHQSTVSSTSISMRQRSTTMPMNPRGRHQSLADDFNNNYEDRERGKTERDFRCHAKRSVGNGIGLPSKRLRKTTREEPLIVEQPL